MLSDPLKRWFSDYGRVIWLVVFCVASIFCLFYILFNQTNYIDTTPANQQPLTVRGYTVGSGGLYTQSIATVDNKNRIVVTSISQSMIQKIEVDPGEKIKDGDKLALLTQNYFGKTKIHETEIDMAQKELSIAETYYNSLKNIKSEEDDLADETLEDFETRQKNAQDHATNLQDQIQNLELLIDILENEIINLKSVSGDAELKDKDNIFSTPLYSIYYKDKSANTNNTSLTEAEQLLYSYKSQLVELKNTLAEIEAFAKSKSSAEAIAELTQDITKNQTQRELDLAKLDVDLKRLNLDLVKARADLNTVFAPIKGTIEKVFVKTGELINPGDPLFLINGEEEFVLVAKVSADLAKQIDPKAKSIVRLENEIFESKIEFVSSTSVQNNLYEIIIEPDKDLAKKLYAGISIEIELPLIAEDKDNENSTYVPLDSVFGSDDNTYVLVYQNGKAIMRPITIGEITGGNQIIVTSGLQKDEIVIVDRRVIPDQSVMLDAESQPEEEKDDEEKQDQDLDENEEEDTETEKTEPSGTPTKTPSQT